MRVNIYSQELTNEIKPVAKDGFNDLGQPATFHAVRLYLHSSNKLHHNAEDDDRSGITFWLPKSDHRRADLAATFRALADLVLAAPSGSEPS